MLRSLIFVTPKNLLLEYEKVKNYLLVNNSNKDKYISGFLKYFEDNYILSLKQTFKRLNVIDILKEDIPLTTNYAESFNRTPNSTLDKEHPNICVFLKVIRSMQHET
ncbi:hypothetical protein DMUE_6191 [Dictyocoela muelleri]|nr:hypothetical protein DMUE_6191 [Dictyocoela muelleri]